MTGAPTDTEDGTEWFPPAPSSGWRLVSATGPRRFGALHAARHPCEVVMSPDDTVIYAAYGGVHALTRAGVPLPGAPQAVGASVTLAAGGAHALARTLDGELMVLDLASMSTLFRTTRPRKEHGHVIAGDGSVVGSARALFRVRDGAPLPTVEGLCSLSRDGTLALARVYRRGVDYIQLWRVGGELLHEERVSATSSYDLCGVAWSSTHVAFVHGGGVELRDLGAPSQPSSFSDPLRKHLRVLFPCGPEHWLVVTEGRTVVIDQHGAPRRSFEDAGTPLAVTHDGTRALVWWDGVHEELDLESGKRTSLGDARRDAVTTLMAGEAGVLVVRKSGVVVRWDPVACAPTQRLPSVQGAFALDGPDGVLACDGTGLVRAITHTGTERFRCQLPTPDTKCSWSVARVERVPDGQPEHITLRVRWRVEPWHLAAEHADRGGGDATEEVVLDAMTGALQHHRSVPEVGRPRGPSTSFHHAGLRGDVPPELGKPTAVAGTPDGARVVVGTDTSMLLTYQRP